MKSCVKISILRGSRGQGDVKSGIPQLQKAHRQVQPDNFFGSDFLVLPQEAQKPYWFLSKHKVLMPLKHNMVSLFPWWFVSSCFHTAGLRSRVCPQTGFA